MILLLKPPELVQPGLRKARGDEGRGDTTTTGAMSGPSGLLHDVVVGGRIMEEIRDVGAVQVRSGGRDEEMKEFQEQIDETFPVSDIFDNLQLYVDENKNDCTATPMQTPSPSYLLNMFGKLFDTISTALFYHASRDRIEGTHLHNCQNTSGSDCRDHMQSKNLIIKIGKFVGDIRSTALHLASGCSIKGLSEETRH